ncbi:Afadin- and alpha-actinin-binding protein, partial [Ophiophagus hannah]
MSQYISELGFSPAESAFSPAHFTDSLELQGSFHELDNIVCWSDNMDHCISYLNKDDGSGDGIEHGFDLLELVNGACRLLNLYQSASAKLGDVEAEKMRRDEELDYLREHQGKLKERVEVLEREIAIVQNKDQQLQSKNKHLNDMLKEEKEEQITKLLSSLANQKNQHGHEMKRKEQELLRLKDKMSQILTNKTDKRGTIEILNALPRMDGKRATWKTGRSLGRKEEELYRIQLAKQEQREEGLAFENAKLKQLLNELIKTVIYIQIQRIPKIYSSTINIWKGRKSKEENSQNLSYPTCFYRALDCQMSEGDGPNPMVIVTDHDKEIMKLKKEIEESRGLIALQQQCFQEQLMSAANSELPAHLKGSYFLEEQQLLQEERELFEEQKQTFEVERKNFTEAAIRLGWERKQFEEQKAQFLKQEFLKPNSPQQLSKRRETYQHTACQTEIAVKDDLQNDSLDRFLNSFF